jgi:hypothetical protein
MIAKIRELKDTNKKLKSENRENETKLMVYKHKETVAKSVQQLDNSPNKPSMQIEVEETEEPIADELGDLEQEQTVGGGLDELGDLENDNSYNAYDDQKLASNVSDTLQDGNLNDIIVDANLEQSDNSGDD